MFAIAVFLATVNERLVEWFIEPLFEKLTWDKFWLLYIAMITGGIIGWFSGINLFSIVEELPVLAGRILTALVVGGGSELLHMLFGAADRVGRHN